MGSDSPKRPCSTFSGKLCQLGNSTPDLWHCCVCDEVDSWLKRGEQTIGVREVEDEGVVVFAPRGNEACTGALLLLSAGLSSADDIRRTVHDVLRVVETVWLEDPDSGELRLLKNPAPTAQA